MRDLTRAGVHPSLGSVGEGASGGPWLTYFASEAAGTPFDLAVDRAWSLRGDSHFGIRFGRVPHVTGGAPSRRRSLEALTPSFAAGANERRSFAYVDLRRVKHPGDAWPHETGTDITYEDRAYELVLGRALAPPFVASLRTGWLETRASRGPAGVGPLDDRVGLDRSFFGTTLSLAYDRRDDRRDPRRGTFVEASLGRHVEVGRGSTRVDRVSIDVRHFARLGSDRHVLALRGLAGRAETSGDGPVPHFAPFRLGGPRSVRGFSADRFAGPRVAAFSAEYRWNVKGPLGLALFSDFGRAWSAGAERPTAGVARSHGLGLFLKAKDVLFRVDAARGSHGTRVHVSLGHSF